ncbi:MAG: MAPEG family protein [Parasphingopyxis sp.]|uniref:MAPEG family protein n=1 Tax=Parasphingopyxis sp. TaxID=1920299 RepID=UPI003FA1926D
MNSGILAPAAVLVVWTLIMMIWVMVTRLPAMKKAGIDMGARPGGRGQDLQGVVPDSVNWKAHNYNHLMEQPTIFYATVFIVALTGTGDVWLNVWLAWAYVGLRIVHSIVQATWNHVPARFAVFMLSSLALLALALHATAAALQ